MNQQQNDKSELWVYDFTPEVIKTGGGVYQKFEFGLRLPEGIYSILKNNCSNYMVKSYGDKFLTKVSQDIIAYKKIN